MVTLNVSDNGFALIAARVYNHMNNSHPDADDLYDDRQCCDDQPGNNDQGTDGVPLFHD